VPSSAHVVVLVAGGADPAARRIALVQAVGKEVRTLRVQSPDAAVLIVGPTSSVSDAAHLTAAGQAAVATRMMPLLAAALLG
jgi:hypothetical protein